MSVALVECRDKMKESLVEAIYFSTENPQLLHKMYQITQKNEKYATQNMLETIETLYYKCCLEQKLPTKKTSDKKVKI